MESKYGDKTEEAWRGFERLKGKEIIRRKRERGEDESY